MKPTDEEIQPPLKRELVLKLMVARGEEDWGEPVKRVKGLRNRNC